MSLERKCISDVSSVNGGLETLRQKILLDEIGEMCNLWRSREGGPNPILAQFNWETEYAFSIGRNRPRFDGFKNRVGLEHETREQMNIRSHLLWAEAGYQSDEIDVSVFVIPSGNDGSVSRTARELNDEIFTQYFPIECPLLLVEYDPS
jgi:hypothetical protein